MSNFQTHIKGGYLEYFLWNGLQVNYSIYCWWWRWLMMINDGWLIGAMMNNFSISLYFMTSDTHGWWIMVMIVDGYWWLITNVIWWNYGCQPDELGCQPGEFGCQPDELGCQPDEPLASLVTMHQQDQSSMFMVVVMLLMYSVLHCLYSVGNKITTTTMS